MNHGELIYIIFGVSILFLLIFLLILHGPVHFKEKNQSQPRLLKSDFMP